MEERIEEIEVVIVRSWLNKVDSCFDDSVSMGGIERREERREGFLCFSSPGELLVV